MTKHITPDRNRLLLHGLTMLLQKAGLDNKWAAVIASALVAGALAAFGVNIVNAPAEPQSAPAEQSAAGHSTTEDDQ